ncbi:DUF4258 domain-containing protein [Rhizobium glycinendophyticum]|uniref:DUF4258 domain-containing protein n=1 Tax=Rhizobium glycinendophyticum TaxID=2589807 RepID=A0A504US78_9HYPH|nr:DUF4258 domain-containing protein [Rhizobium glycinendophyticum]TPP11556.1 DUF4258 domain-containing protein [Rhizobium glycinendophyticum]
MKPLHFTLHAETVISERQLDRSGIELSVREPDWHEADPAGPPTDQRYRRIPERDDRIMRVICLATTTEIPIITAFLDRKARMSK